MEMTPAEVLNNKTGGRGSAAGDDQLLLGRSHFSQKNTNESREIRKSRGWFGENGVIKWLEIGGI